jgi:two-component system response regulator MprA
LAVDSGARTTLERWFCARGFAVDSAEDGMEAVERCEVGRYDAVMMDFQMPKMSGCETIVSIRQIRPGIPILVLAGHPDDVQRAMVCGASRALLKPVRLHDLEREVRAWMT